MPRRITIAFVFLLAFVPLYGQTVSGHIFDATDGKPMPGVIVRSRDSTGNTLKYVMTDKEGRFSIAIGKEASSLSFALLGYTEVRYDAPFETNYEVRLEVSAERIKESVVQAKKVQIAGDTISYNVKALSTREDLVLGDVLKRIPGIEVTSTGHLKVDGKDLGKFYVNGKDVLEGNYNLATRKLSVNEVKKVEVLRNHQYVKMLRGMQESDQAAVNIILDDSAKNKINVLESFSGGYQAGKPFIPHSESLTSFFLGDEFSSVNDAGFDASGNPSRETTSFRLPTSDNRYSIDSKLSIASAKAPLRDNRSLFNKTLDTRTVNTLTSSEDVKMGATLRYSWDERVSSDSRKTVYHLTDGTDRVINRYEDRFESGGKLIGKLNYSKNGNRSYVNETLFADIGKHRGTAEVSGDDIRSQDGEKKMWDVNNKLNTLFKIGSSLAVGLKSYTQISGFSESLDIFSRSISERIGSSAIFQDLSINDISRTRNNLTLSLRPGMRWTYFKRDASLIGLPEEEVPGLKADRMEASYLIVGLDWSAYYRIKRFLFGIDGNLHYDRASYGDAHQGKLLSDESVLAKYETGRLVLSAEGGISTTRPDIQDLGSVLILYDYDGLRRGQESLSFLPNRFVGGELIFREPITGWYTRATSRYNNTRSLLGGRDVLENYIVSYNTDETIGYDMWSSSAEITKGIYAINGKISAIANYSRTSSTFRQNEKTVGYVSHIVTPTIEIMTSPLSFWNINGRGSISFIDMYIDGQPSGKTRSATVSFTNSFYITEKISAGIVTDLFHNSTVNKTIIFPDAFIAWRGSKKLRMKVSANNLLNYKEYSYASVSPLLENTFTYMIRPFSILLSFDWTL